MFKKVIFAMVLALCVFSPAKAANIVWVAEALNNGSGVPYDQGWIDLLTAQGYTVDVQRGSWMTLSDAQIATLNNADLVIFSRTTNSGNYAADAAEVTQWNSVTAPMISAGAYQVRNSRWLWINSATIIELASAPESPLKVVKADHPIFTGVAAVNGEVDVIDETVDSGQMSFIVATDPGNGTILGTRSSDGNIWIEEWAAGKPFYSGSTQTPAGKRMLLTAGGGSGQTMGSENFNLVGEKIFLNAVLYMLGKSLRPGIAVSPSPASGAKDVQLTVDLNWTAGDKAVSHNVYFGTSFDDVNAASESNPKGVLVAQGQSGTTFDPGRLLTGQTYYWRVDEIDESGVTHAGEVWSFTTEPLAYPITAKIAATASSQKSTAEGPENTINSSGMAGDVADVNSKAMWQTLSTKNGGTFPPAWIQYDFDKLYKLQEMWVWNYNGSSELDMGAGANSTTIEYLAADGQWVTLGNFEFAQASGEDGYAHNTTVAFNGAAAKAVRLTINTNWGYKYATGLSEVRFFYLPVWAKEPKPASDSTNIDPTTVVLTWRSGREAGSHDVYVGTDANALTKVDTVATAGYTPTVELGTKYYWRIDEVNQTTNPTTWAGEVWNFTTPAFLVVDDMESYNATDKAIFDTWVDGYGTTTNGGQVGYGQPANNTFSETVTTHGGTRSMPFLYGRDGITTSEATRTYATAQNWKAAGIKTLTLWFYGAAQNSAVSLYAKINDTKIVYSGAAANLQRLRWNQWNIDLTTVAAAGAVAKLTIGVTGAGTGTLLIDDLRLYKDVAAVLPPVDPGTNGLVSYFNMEGGKVADSISGVTGALNDTTFVDSATTALGKALMCTGGTTAETTQFVDLGTTYWDKVVSKLSNCTFSVWTNYTGVGSVWQRLFDFGSGQNVNTYISSSGATMGVPQFAVKTGVANSGSTGTGNVETLVRGRVMSVGWHHIAGVVDNSGAYPTISIYVDGVLSGGPVAGRLPQDMTLQATPGAWQNYLGKSNWPDPYLNGAVDELRVFNRVLTSGEISYLSGDR